MNINPIYLKDFYKVGHVDQYPEGTSLVFSNFTPRKSRMPGVNHSVFFGLQYLLKKYLINDFEKGFFSDVGCIIEDEYSSFMNLCLSQDSNYSHIRKLRELGYLPLAIYALPELEVVPCGVPALVMYNTHPDFYWLPNMLETLLSCTLWQPCTSATIAREYRILLDDYAEKTSDIPDMVDYQAHDFSMRGMSSVESACLSGIAHLQYFKGTDCIPALMFNQEYYGKPLHIASVPATEHSVMSAGGKENELQTYNRLLDTYPSGILSIVSDTWNLWNVISDILPKLKDRIMQRDGKIVIRPDSGNPADIVCGFDDSPDENCSVYSKKGVVESLWDIFGGTINSKGYKQLDSHIGCIYGDSITLDRARDICELLEKKGFASTNIVFGIGSYCVEHSTHILCSDLIWRKASELKEGQEILAFDENPSFGEGKHAARKYRTAKIEFNIPADKDCFTIETDIGKPITASHDHPWLIWSQNRNKYNTHYASLGSENDPRGPGLIWKKTSELKLGDKIAFFGNPWEEENTKDSGWLSGIYDGEGSYSKCTENDRIPHWKISISQNAGIILDKIKEELKLRNFSYYENNRGCNQLVLKGGWYENIRFLGTISPIRLLEKYKKTLTELPALSRTRTYHLASITGINNVGKKTVASIRTSCGTFITNGYLSHNTYQYNTRDTLGWAMKATYCEVNGEGRAITKDPITDDGTKRSHSGILKVIKDYEQLFCRQEQTWEQFHMPDNELKLVFKDGKIIT